MSAWFADALLSGWDREYEHIAEYPAYADRFEERLERERARGRLTVPLAGEARPRAAAGGATQKVSVSTLKTMQDLVVELRRQGAEVTVSALVTVPDELEQLVGEEELEEVLGPYLAEGPAEGVKWKLSAVWADPDGGYRPWSTRGLP